MMKVIETARVVMALALASVVVISGASEAHAFCGFYVSGATKKMYNNATEVVMMREGTRTVLSMRNNYEGPPKDFAMVVPVPQILEEENVKVLQDALFDKIDTLAAPRLVEYWQQDPCYRPPIRYKGVVANDVSKDADDDGNGFAPVAERMVVIEAEFDVGEYNVVILSAKESNALEKWLLANKYNIPKGASAALASYIAQGQYFFVAKVDPKKVKFVKGQAMLSPLRFHYDSKDFALPVRLGLLNAKGAQDLIVHILAIDQRYEVANYPNVTIPTNLVVPQKTRKNFAEFYTALFDYTLEQHPRAVVTEYSWDASTCDPCPGPTLDQADLATLGMDVIDAQEEVTTVTVLEMDPITSSNVAGNAIRDEFSRVARNSSSKLKSCYSELVNATPEDKREAINRGRVNMVVTIAPSGALAKVEYPWNSIRDETMVACMTEVAKKWQISTKPTATATLNIPMQFYSYNEVTRPFDSRSWTLTRLHTRYTSKTMTEDLIFEQAEGIVGGRGMPQGKRGEMSEEGVEFTSYNNFQGRYIMLNYYKGKIACEKKDYYWRWGGPPSGKREEMFTAQDTAFTPRGKVKLTKEVKKAAKAHFKKEEILKEELNEGG